MHCWKCGTELEDPPSDKLTFRAICDRCDVWLHCCCNCKNYKPGLPNDCAVPGTEHVSDREGCNFCEDFQLLGKPSKKTVDSKTVKDSFDSLFKD